MNETQGVSEPVDPKLIGIGGWLTFTAIGFVLGPIMGVIGIIVALGLFSQVADAGFGGIYALEIVALIGLVAFMIYAVTRFFGKKRNAPAVIITYLLVSLGTSAVLLVIELAAGAELFAVETGKQLVREVVAAAIWIPYFRVSKRVKATFVN